MRIVCVDFATNVVNIAETIRKAAGEKDSIYIYHTASAALKHIRTYGCDVLFTEIDLAGPTDGIQLVEVIRREYPQIRVAFMNTHSFSEKMNRIMPLQPDFYLPKPIRFSVLKKVIQSLANNINHQQTDD